MKKLPKNYIGYDDQTVKYFLHKNGFILLGVSICEDFYIKLTYPKLKAVQDGVVLLALSSLNNKRTDKERRVYSCQINKDKFVMTNNKGKVYDFSKNWLALLDEQKALRESTQLALEI